MGEIYKTMVVELRKSMAIQFQNIASVLEDPDYLDPELDEQIWEMLGQVTKICNNQIEIEKEYRKEFN